MKADALLIAALMEACPSSIAAIKEFCVANGYMDPSGRVPRVEERVGLQKKKPPTAVPKTADAHDEYNMGDAVPCQSPMHASVEYLGWVLQEVDGVVFNAMNMKSMLKRGQRKPSRQSLLEVLEFVCGMEAQAPWGCVGTNQQLVEHLKKETCARGNRQLSLRLPPDWASVGTYDVAADMGGLLLMDKYARDGQARKVLLPWELFGATDSCSILDFSLNMNWSEKKAFVSFAGSLKAVNAYESFLSGPSGCQRDIKLQAITDGSMMEEPSLGSPGCKKPRSDISTPGSGSKSATTGTPSSLACSTLVMGRSLTRELADLMDEDETQVEEAIATPERRAGVAQADAELSFEAQGLVLL